jgi:hypothetical protein
MSEYLQDIQRLDAFVLQLKEEISQLKQEARQLPPYDQDLIKSLYEISDAARRVGGYISLLRARTSDSDRWILNRLAELGTKITHSEALINE